MILVKDISLFKKRYSPIALTIGNFDGIHLGHQALLKKVISCSKSLRIPAGVLTFYPHPLKILSPQKCPPFLSTFREKKDLFASLGLDILICLRFSEKIKNKTPKEFVREILCEKLGTKIVIVGHDYSFGRNREGNEDFLKRVRHKYNFDVMGIEALKDNSGVVISSTRTRNSLAKGDVEDAAKCLGRFYSISGNVVLGDKKGEELLIKTAKIITKEKILPQKGVYIAQVNLEGRNLPAVLNIGNQPTFGNYKTSLEIHILDFEKNIYQKTLTVRFIKKLRNEKKFSSVPELKKQIEKDIEETRFFFNPINGFNSP